MRLKPNIWHAVSLLLFAAAIGMWLFANRYEAQHHPAVPPSPSKTSAAPAKINTVATNAVAKRKSYRLSNTHQKLAQLLHNNHALILRNALIDTTIPVALPIPEHLKAKGAPGSYLVQADRPLDKNFYDELRQAGAAYVSYVPNNAALVRATPDVATNLALQQDIVAVLPYDPYYKLDSTLLPSAVEQEPQTNALSVTTFPGQRDAALAALTQLGATLIGEDRSPFGPTLIVHAPSTSLVAIAQMPLAQEIEAYTPRHIMNDLTRVLMGDSTDTLIGTSNYLGLTGSHVMVNLNDSGVDGKHPDFQPTGRLIGDFPGSLTDDSSGHGTHVAGIIAGNGSKSGTVTYPIPGSVTNADFRGKATNATLFVQSLDLDFGPFISDSFLQENASSNLGPTNLISNNSWGYYSSVYDIHAASFDAATRDAQPNVDGEQPLLFVFAAGNSGDAPSDNGLNGVSDSIVSPGTAKNVITVGASDSPRYITNLVSFDGVTTNEAFYGSTDNTNLVASFSSCGNVGIGVDGFYGRFKPDVVAPGVFTISCRATNYIDPTNETFVNEIPFPAQLVSPGKTNNDQGGYSVYIPNDTAGVTVIISSNAASPVPFPTNMYLVAGTNYPPTTLVATNFVQSNAFNLIGFKPGDFWFFGVVGPTNAPAPVNYDLSIYVFETNSEGDYFTVLEALNSPLKPYYRYDSGTSMSAGAVSGTLALMQEFLQSHLSISNPSPALLKAMLINGSRSLGLQYDFNVNTPGANEQGWGLPNLPNSIPTNLSGGNASMVLLDQSASRSLGTGQYQTYTVSCSDSNATTFFPVRVSLVWTDPPGNPNAGVELVNNLQLTVCDATGTNVFIGNDFLSGDIFTVDSNPTNLPPGESDNEVQNIFVNNTTVTVTSAGDSINNVQNVYINPNLTPITFPLTITVSGTRVNVNAVTTQTNNVLQDYALVVSSDDPALSSAVTMTTNAIATNKAPLITVASNGLPLLHQRVGANEPNLYNFPASSTNGSLSQWHFFVFTNSILSVSNATNVAFATFLPPNLSIPRASGSADIDLYVYTNGSPLNDFGTFITTPGNLDIFANQAIKSVGRTGTETVIFTNSTILVYYIGVKSEDQQASDFGFYGIAQSNSFSATSADGNTITATGTSLPVSIPDATSPTPALVFAFMADTSPTMTMIRRVTVNLGVQYPTANDLVGTLQFNGMATVLNSYTSVQTGGFTNTYDDLQEDPGAHDARTVGPGSLTEYIGQKAEGLWLLTESSKAVGQSGAVNQYTVSVDLDQPPSGFFVTIPPNSWYDGYVLVPNDATNMIIDAAYSQGVGPIGIYLTNEVGVISTADYGSNNIGPPGGSLSLNTNSPIPGWPGSPPLAGGYWFYGLYNSGSADVTLFVQILFQESLTPNLVQNYTNNTFIPLTTDGHTQSEICISNGQQVVGLQIGVRINDTNLDDLVLHLTSPEGTSITLFEDRGGTLATNLGLTVVNSNGINTNGTTNFSTNFVYTVFTEYTNLANTPIKFAPPPYALTQISTFKTLATASFEDDTNGAYFTGSVLDGWLVTNNVVTALGTNGLTVATNDEVGIVTDPAGDLIITPTPGTNTFTTNSLGTNYLALTSGRIIQTFGTNTFAVTNGMPYELVFYAKPMGVTDWWSGNQTPNEVFGYGTNNGTIPDPLNVTYGVGVVGDDFAFSGTSPTSDDHGNEVDFGTNTGNFGTNNFSVDFWIKVPLETESLFGILEKKEACVTTSNFWDILCGPTTNVLSQPGCMSFEISDNGGTNDIVLLTTNGINDGVFHHVAFVRDGLTLSLYIDGILNAATNAAGIANLTNDAMFRAGQSVCVGSGVDPFEGDLDELDLVNRALSPAEVYGIYSAGSQGKFNTNSAYPNFWLTIDNVTTNNVVLSNAPGVWQLFTNTFYATNDAVTIEFSGNPMGVLLDDIQLIQLPATNYNNYYLPEEPLTTFVGENPLGCWTLDVWDTRQDSPLPVNGSLLSWTMQVTTSSTNAVLYVLTNRMPFTNTTLPAGNMAYFAVDVPAYAHFATNILDNFANGPLTLYFDQSALPTGGLPGDITLATGVAAGTISTNTLATIGGAPPLLPGQRYFLGVQNNGAVPANFSIEVDFDGMTNKIIPLTNTIPYTNLVGTNTLGTNGPEYYSFVVPTNAVQVTFQILNVTNDEVDLYAREGLPVPGPQLFDYDSCDTGTNDQFIVVTTDSVPVALPVYSPTNPLPPLPTTWYLAAYNPLGVTNINYTIVATFVTNGGMDIIPLSNAAPYTNIAAPGYPSNLVYSFAITNNPSGVEFAVTNLSGSGNVQLLASLNTFPTPQQSYAGSFLPGTNTQLIEILPNAALPSLNGIWYLTVPNTSGANVNYTITATTNFIVAPPNLPITWTGRIDDVWDILATSNWVVTGSVPPTNYPYQDDAALIFDDTAIRSTVLLAETVAPASMTFNNFSLAYTLIGSGSINSAPFNTPLSMEDGGTLILDNTSPNTFFSITLDEGTLQIGNNDANGSIGNVAVDTGGNFFGTLVFDRTDNITVPNQISDTGGFSQIGTGILNLSGFNSYEGTTTVSRGTLIPDNTSALGFSTEVFINNGGTFDLGGLPPSGPGSPPFPFATVIISGSGVGGNGAIVNNGPNQQLGGLEAIALDGDASIGGTTRWDIRNGSPTQLVLHFNTLTKTGPNQISVVSAYVGDPSQTSRIIINQGIFSFEGTPTFQNVASITVNANALVGQNMDTLGSFTAPIQLNGGGSTNLSGGGTTYLDAPIQLLQNGWLGNGAGTEIFDGVISGSSALTNLGIGSNLLSATNTFTGTIYVEQGTFGLIGNGSIFDSTNIIVSPGATFDATQRIDGTLTLASNQTLIDNGTVVGSNVVAQADSIINVGLSGVVSANVEANGAIVFDSGAIRGNLGENSNATVTIAATGLVSSNAAVVSSLLTVNGAISGNVTENAAAIVVIGPTGIVGSNVTTANSTLFVNGVVGGSVAAASNSIVYGSKTVTGNLALDATSILSPGPTNATIGTLTVGGMAALGGTTYIELDKALAPGQSNDVLAAGAIIYGGTLFVTNLDTVDKFVAGDSFHVFISTNITGAFTSIVLPPLTNGLLWTNDFASHGGTLRIISTAPPIVPLSWDGTYNGNWDILQTSNWIVTGSSPPQSYPYQDHSPVIFDDNANGPTTVDLTTLLSPASVTITNNLLVYDFVGPGAISNAPLVQSNGGYVIFDNTGANSFSSVTVSNSLLQIGDGDAAGSLGPAPIYDIDGTLGALAFDRSDNILISNVITGAGALEQIGPGTLTLSGQNTYSNSTLIASGTVVVDNTNALGAWGPLLVEIVDGGTLDLGGLPVAYPPAIPIFGPKQFFIAGAGVGGEGAIVNNGTNQQLGGLESVTLLDDSSIGGNTRWDIRSNAVSTVLDLEGWNLTKTGSNRISVVSAFVTAGDIIVDQGILSFEGTPDFSPTPSGSTITVNSGGLLGQSLDTSNSFTWQILLDGGGTTNLAGSGVTYLDSPIDLQSNSSFGNGGGIEIFDGVISDSGSLTNLGSGSNMLAANNTYTGTTVVAQGVLGLTNNGSISDSTNIIVDFGATLDASGSTDQALTLSGTQTLYDNGKVNANSVVANGGSSLTVGPSGLVTSNLQANNSTLYIDGIVGGSLTATSNSVVYGTNKVNGNLTLAPTATLSPGASNGAIGTLTVGGTVFLAGTNYIELNQGLAPAQSNDMLTAGAIVYGGTLLVTNLDPTNGFAAGESFTIFNSPTISGAFTNLILPTLPAGLFWTNNFSGHGGSLFVVVNVNVPNVPITWTGAVNGNWDILTTSNWVVTGSSPATNYTYQNGSVVTFNDSASNGATTVNLTTTLAPASINFSNQTLSYTLTGSGNIIGAPLALNNTGTVIIDNTGSNNFSSVTVNNGTLIVGLNDTHGTLGASPVITNDNSLIFFRTDNVVVSNVIAGSGTLAQIGTGKLVLSGTNTYSNATLINSGTIVVDNTNALGAWGPTPVDIGGGTLDLGGLPVAYGPASPLFGPMQFDISGTGMGGIGAIVNNGTNQELGGLEYVALNGSDATIGGNTRWDIRNNSGPAILNLNSNTLTKTGTNQISVNSGTVSAGNIIINQGILSFAGTPVFSTNLTSSTITVNSGAFVGQNLDTTNSFTRTIVLNGGGTTNLSGGGTTYLDAAIVLSNNSSLGNGGGAEVFNGVISGPHSLTILGPGTNLFTAASTYAGTTLIAQGDLVLSNNGSISASTNLVVNPGAILDASPRIDHTLTVAANQTLLDNGTVAGPNVVAASASVVSGIGAISGNLTMDAASTLMPGINAATVGTLTVGGAAFLGGTALFKINPPLAPAQSNDVLAAGSIVFGGTLTVTNLASSNTLAAGNTFMPFNAASSSGSFGAINLPSLPPGLAWQNNFAANGGSITVVAANLTPPVFVSYTIAGGGTEIVLSGTNGTPGGEYILLTSTNMTAPFSTWTPLSTNFYNGAGDFSVTNAVTTNAAQFYLLESP